MTTGDEAKARELLANAKALLLDFDGPICSVFAGLPAPAVAEQLRVVLADGGHTDLPESVATTGDPFDVFRYAATLGDDEARYVEAAFTALEVEAIATAEPTPGAHDLIHAWHETDRPLAIVSNNSVTAIRSYMALYDVESIIELVAARSDHRVELLKPNPYLVQQALTFLSESPGQTIMLGDSRTDVEAARAAGAVPVGYTNKSAKERCLTQAGSAANTSSIASLLTCLPNH
ncbi:HAD family hydrolase [Amycolatopsis sp. 195334CR]|uniref:HAD family hydrolase n=1 Tax=Amycolatopsis sp. 195334CR TaxID=2814588 RepID=UPI001A8DD472|nr:HAD-IA family hydrolase [Amycolatopsis sp. 195334CR]MBN6036031.1 HAD family hydrolase [Amycolatopsis sp. 195334CR]